MTTNATVEPLLPVELGLGKVKFAQGVKAGRWVFATGLMAQDFINGIFLLLENAMQVGDWVTAGGLAGTVENLSIRTLRLRAGDGSVHIIPFSSVTTITNSNRGIGNAVISVTVAYDEDTDWCLRARLAGLRIAYDSAATTVTVAGTINVAIYTQNSGSRNGNRNRANA